jgi:hypothetical protein
VIVPSHAPRPLAVAAQSARSPARDELRGSRRLRYGAARTRRGDLRAVRAPGSATPAQPPGLQLAGVEPHVAAQPHVRYPVGACLGEHPSRRHVEQSCRALRVKQRCHVTGLRERRRRGRRGRGGIAGQMSRLRGASETSNIHALIVGAGGVTSGVDEQRQHASILAPNWTRTRTSSRRPRSPRPRRPLRSVARARAGAREIVHKLRCAQLRRQQRPGSTEPERSSESDAADAPPRSRTASSIPKTLQPPRGVE